MTDAMTDAILDDVLDAIVPPRDDVGLPGAGGLGVAAHIRAMLSKTPDFEPLIERGLQAVDEAARRRDPTGFGALSQADREAVLNEASESEPGFLPTLILHTYTGYYEHPRVLDTLGLEGRPPSPQGYTMEPTDFSLLDEVRKRPKLYREG